VSERVPTSKLTRQHRDAEERKYLGDLHIGTLKLWRDCVEVGIVDDHHQLVMEHKLAFLAGDPLSDRFEKIAFALQLALLPAVAVSINAHLDEMHKTSESIETAFAKRDASTASVPDLMDVLRTIGAERVRQAQADEAGEDGGT
jgi:hypothetical protein